MSSEATRDQPTSTAPELASKPQALTGARWSRVALVLAVPIVLAIVVIAGIAMGWEEVLHGWIKPKLVPVTGQVEFDGKPVPGGFVRAQYLDGTGGIALGPLDEAGRFTLSTDDLPGAVVGRHKLMVYYMDNSFPPKSLIPQKYSQPETSPLTIQVTSSSDKNHFVIKLDAQ